VNLSSREIKKQAKSAPAQRVHYPTVGGEPPIQKRLHPEPHPVEPCMVSTEGTCAVYFKCHAELSIDRASFLCPECGGMASEIVSGQELEIAHIEAK